MRKKFAFLILHYKNADVTMNCVDSILSTMSEKDYDVVVVDNASDNGSYEMLVDKYREESNVFFLKNEENLGYAKGNNVGFSYAKNELKSEWICLANNDVTFFDPLWIKKVTEIYQKNPYYVLGPDIVTPEGVHQNPFRNTVANKRQIFSSLLHDIAVYVLLKMGIQRKIKAVIKKKDEQDAGQWKESRETFAGVLHGSCLLFSPNYIKEFDGLYSGTFLYVEEEILCYILNKLGYRYSYSCDVQVNHCHATTFKKSISDEDKRKMVVIRHRIRSYCKFLKIAFSGNHVKDYLQDMKMKEKT